MDTGGYSPFFKVVGPFSRLQLRRKPDSGPESGEMRSFDALLDYNRCSDSGTQIIIGLSTGGRFMLIQLIHLL